MDAKLAKGISFAALKVAEKFKISSFASSASSAVKRFD